MTAIPDRLRAALGERYDLERVIGQGGMASVYLAADKKHGRKVAVKVLREDLTATLGAERFLREIRIVAQLQHPHILLLIDSGEANGFLYYVMPFVEGESLRQRLDRRGVLAPDEVVQLARQVADALDYAHRHGVVHRDIKPENILLSDGHAIVADFGIAKALTAASDKALTRTGYPVGTVGYMSPEQAAGFQELDERSDVFSLMCVVYEMLVGRVPGMWPSDDSARVLRFLEAPAEHRTVLETLPGSVEQVLVRGLVLRPDRRFGGPREAVEALAEAFGEKPRFSDHHAREIVARAADLEATTPTHAGNLSLGGIQQLAADVGIAPEHVARAARELNRPASPPIRTSWFLGTPTRIVVERVIEGEVGDHEYPTIVDEVRMVFANVGQSSTLGRSLSWHTMTTPGTVGRSGSLSLTPANGRTRLRVEENLEALARGLFGGLMGPIGGLSIPAGIGISVAALHLPFLVPFFIAAGVGGSWTIARAGLRHIRGKRVEELERLGDRLADHIADSIQAGRRRLGRG